MTDEDIRAAVANLTGDIQQVPSSVSAIKVNGERSYAKVRAGGEVNLPARPVTVSRFEVHDIRRENGGRLRDVDVTVDCSSGTYIRALARDLGAALGVGGHLTALRRTCVGPFSLEQASTLEELAEDLRVLDLDDAAADLFPVRSLSAAEAGDLSHGRRISATGTGEPGSVAAIDPDGRVVGLLEDKGEQAKALLVFTPGNEKA